ncbi:MAG TPA: FtsX-like permease family protein [Pyrinomonadaceae bacterium]|jgi:lipoprotein-releasing system permease protein|nr:FtsX-like permease family protein [Pyrinomonadaceae bacterium]
MRFELSLARRYLRSPGRGLAKITGRLAVAGIAFGVAAMIFALALSRGFREEVQEKLLANTAHISISRVDGGNIENAGQIKNELSNIDGIGNIAAAGYVSALLITAHSNTYTVLRAREEIQPDHSGGRDGCIAASFGSELAKKTGLQAGDKVDAVFGVDNDRDNGGDNYGAKKICIVVKETFSTGIYDYDSTQIRLSLADLMRESGGYPTMLEVSARNIYDSKIIAEAAGKKLGGEYKVLDWQEANKPFFAAMSFERRVVLIIISLVILLSALNITFTLALGVTQRRQDIAIMKTAGAKTPNVILVFLFEGLYLGLVGVVFGTVLGLLACFLSNYFGLLTLPPEVYAVNKITLRPDAIEILFVITATLLLTLASTLYPAFLAARVKPWENLRQ